MKSIFKTFVFLSILLISGCFSSRYNHEADITTINRSLFEKDPLHMIMKNGTEYIININKMDSLFIEGTGSVKKVDHFDWQEFSGKVVIDSIDLLQFTKFDFGKNIIVYGGAATLTIMGLLANEGPDQPDIYQPGGESCPFIYSWNGDDYVLEGEAFGSAFGKSLEIKTSCMLPSLYENNSQLKIKITNERPETHYLNSVELIAIETDCNATPYFDTNHNIWPVYNLKSPIIAEDHSDNNILEQISKVDGSYWQSDLAQASFPNNFEDQIELQYINSTSSDEVTIILHAINTKIANFVFDNIFKFLGDRSLSFIRAVENDPQMTAIIKNWLKECSLKFSIWDGEDWQSVGFVYPEANEVSFNKAIRCRIPNTVCDTIKVRLTCLADVWNIDAVLIDQTPVQPLHCNPVKLKSAIDINEHDVSYQLLKSDDKYVMLLPSEQIEFSYKANQYKTGKKITYGIQVQGYLYEWIAKADNQSIFSFANLIPSESKISYLKNLLELKNKKIFLTPIYAGWGKYKIAN